MLKEAASTLGGDRDFVPVLSRGGEKMGKGGNGGKNPNYPSTTGKKSGGNRGNTPK
jgi:hypothetical protein